MRKRECRDLTQEKVLERKLKSSTQTMEEEGADNQEDVVVVVDLATITKIKIMLKMQVMAKEEETKEQGGVIEAKVDGSNAIIVIQMVARYVAK